MNTPRTKQPSSDSHYDELFRLQLRVARRADALARLTPSGGSVKRDRETWKRAESELWRGVDARQLSARTACEVIGGKP